jgi:uncharacterized protein (DUF1778 family)
MSKMPRSARFEFRVDPDSKTEIEQAAAVAGESASDFARRAAVERAQAILQQQRSTVVPPDFFDALMKELDTPVVPNERTRAAVRRLDEVVKRS